MRNSETTTQADSDPDLTRDGAGQAESGTNAGTTRMAARQAEREAGGTTNAMGAADLRAILDGAADGIYGVDRDGVTTFCNQTFLRMLGFAHETEALGRRLHALVHHSHEDGSPYAERDCPIYQAAQTGEERHVAEETFFRLDGTSFPVEYRVRPIFHDGKPSGAACTFVDLTERRAAERALDAETRRLETLNRTGVAIAAGLDLDRIVQDVTDAGVELAGARFGAFFYNVLDDAGESYQLYTVSGIDRSAFERFPNPRNTDVFRPTFRGEGVVRADDILADPRYGRSAPHHGMPKGHVAVRSYLAVPVASRSGEVLGGLLFGHPEPGRFGEQTERLMLGIAAQAAVAIDNARLYQTAQREIAERRDAEARLLDLTRTLEARVEERTAERDRTWRLSQDLLAVVDTDGTIAAVNRAFTDLLGWQEAELVGARFPLMTHPDDVGRTLDVFHGIFEAPLVEPHHFRLRHRDGSYRWFAWTGAFEDGRVYANGRHATAEHEQAEALARTEEQLRQSQKMEAVGQLTGGLAHDFNNLLAGISGSLELLQARIGQGRLAEADRYLEAAQSSAKRAAALTHRLLAFSRRQTLDPKATDPNRLVADMEELITRTVGPAIGTEVSADTPSWTTLIDPSQLENALLNLCINARDAMPDGGRMTIRTTNETLGAAQARERELQPGQYVVLSVADTGSGMAPDVVARAFDPFYTTKPIGMGTGLGLSMVYGFARQSGGRARIDSRPGAGTTVSLYLRRHDGPAADNDRDGTDDVTDVAPTRRTVLLVDDEATLRMLMTEVVQEVGYRTIEAADGAAALEALRSDARIDLLVTDVGLPGAMNGRQLADAGRAIRPGLKVLFVTGYAENAAVGNGRMDAGMQILTKPFAMNELASRIRRMAGGDETR